MTNRHLHAVKAPGPKAEESRTGVTTVREEGSWVTAHVAAVEGLLSLGLINQARGPFKASGLGFQCAVCCALQSQLSGIGGVLSPAIRGALVNPSVPGQGRDVSAVIRDGF